LATNSTYALVNVTSGSCGQTQIGSAIVTVNTLPTATISGSTTICSGSTTTITFTGTPNAIVTYTVDGGSNQTITLNSLGSATITTPVLTANSTYALVSVTSADATPCSQTQTGSAVVTVISMPIATISGTFSICTGATAVITFTGTPNATVTYTVDGGSNQTIVLSGSGSATIITPVLTTNSTYALVSVSGGASCSQAQIGSAIVTVNALPTASISGTTSICSGGTATITFTGTPNATVTYTVNGGSNQTILLSGTGSATIITPILTTNSTYALVSVASGTTTCSQLVTGSAVVTVNALTAANVTFSYTQTCLNGTNPLPILQANFTTGGAFSSTTLPAANLNTATGAIALAGLSAGTYDVTYLVGSSGCTNGGTYSTTIVLISGFTPETGFTYDATYCSNSGNAFPTKALGFYAGGLFSSTTGLVFVSQSTGEINIAGSTPGTYIIHYDVPVNSANCNLGGSSTWQVIISPALDYAIDDVCHNQDLFLEVVPANSSFNVSDANYTWTLGTITVGTNVSTFNVDEYLTQNPSVNLPVTFSVAGEINGCTYAQGFEVKDNPCKLIPKGISPNNDEMNDTFDLSGMGVTKLLIFNRYGAEVYSFSGNYMKQWGGESNSGKDLPDGTYFYVIHKNNDTKVTGWVYINREY
jgi:gliding motility-associated-like protein